MVTEKFAKRLFVSMLLIFILSLFLMSYLGGDLGLISAKFFWTYFFIIFGLAIISGIPWLIIMKPHDRKVVLIGIAMTLTFYIIKMVYF